jgi:hypothetical protein
MSPRDQKNHEDPQKVKLSQVPNAEIIPDAGKVYLGT